MENPDAPFAIDETSGELFTTDVLDREKVAIYRLKVIGSDKHPTQPLSSSVLVIVVIGDINDHWPQFTNSPYVAYVHTKMAPGERFYIPLAVIYFTLGNIVLIRRREEFYFVHVFFFLQAQLLV